MKLIERSQHHTQMDCRLRPAVRVVPGEVLTIETMDACYGRVRSVDDFMRYREDPLRKSDPYTGPAFIEGARPGGTLIAEILGIELDETGYQLIGPQRAIVRDEIPDWDCYLVRVREGKICLPRGLELPADPVIGAL